MSRPPLHGCSTGPVPVSNHFRWPCPPGCHRDSVCGMSGDCHPVGGESGTSLTGTWPAGGNASKHGSRPTSQPALNLNGPERDRNRRKGTVMNRTKRIRHRCDAAAVGGRFIGPQVVGPRAIAPTVMAPLALAAAAMGALAIGRLAIADAVVHRLRAGEVEIRSLKVGELEIGGQPWPGSASASGSTR